MDQLKGERRALLVPLAEEIRRQAVLDSGECMVKKVARPAHNPPSEARKAARPAHNPPSEGRKAARPAHNPRAGLGVGVVISEAK